MAKGSRQPMGLRLTQLDFPFSIGPENPWPEREATTILQGIQVLVAEKFRLGHTQVQTYSDDRPTRQNLALYVRGMKDLSTRVFSLLLRNLGVQLIRTGIDKWSWKPFTSPGEVMLLCYPEGYIPPRKDQPHV